MKIYHILISILAMMLALPLAAQTSSEESSEVEATISSLEEQEVAGVLTQDLTALERIW